MSKDPGQTAFEARYSHTRTYTWSELPDEGRKAWAATEQAVVDMVAQSAAPARPMKDRIPLSPGFHAEVGETKYHLHHIYTTHDVGENERIHVGELTKDAVASWAGAATWMDPSTVDALQSDLCELLVLAGMSDHARPQSPHEVFQEALGVLRKKLHRQDPSPPDEGVREAQSDTELQNRAGETIPAGHGDARGVGFDDRSLPGEPAPQQILSTPPGASTGGEGRGADDLVAYLHRQWAWSKETFGPALRTKSIIQHIAKELREIEDEPHDLAEWTDVIILAMDGYWRHGGKPEDLLPTMQAKQNRNFARTWPDWRTMGEDQAIEHDRSGEATPEPHPDPIPSPQAGSGQGVEELRKAFEAWETKRYVTAFERNPIGTWGDENGDKYAAPFVQASWEAWQACAALTTPASTVPPSGGEHLSYYDLTLDDVDRAVRAWWKPSNPNYVPDADDRANMADALHATFAGRKPVPPSGGATEGLAEERCPMTGGGGRKLPPYCPICGAKWGTGCRLEAARLARDTAAREGE